MLRYYFPHIQVIEIPETEWVDRIERKLSRVETVTGMDQRCHPGTRVAILEDLCRWLLDDHERSVPSIYWITGVAGCGKSTISRSLLDLARRMGIAHSCFFFSRDHDDRKSCQKLMATVARDLVSYEDPKAIQCVHDAVERSRTRVRFWTRYTTYCDSPWSPLLTVFF
jgi:hypothetical protein